MSILSNLSFDRFHFDEENWWAPTLDLLNFEDSHLTPSKKIILIEEYVHRQVFIPTEVWLWSSWIEALSNCELLHLLNTIRETQEKNPRFRLYIPLEFNLSRPSFPGDLKLKIRDISVACQNVHLHIKACEPIVESIILCLIRKWTRENENKFQKFKVKKFEIYENLGTMYPIIERIFNNIDSKLLALVTGCLFSLKSCKDYPPFILTSSFAHFNKKSAWKIEKKTRKLADKLKHRISSKDDFLKFVKENKLGVSEMYELGNDVQSAMVTVPDLIEINGYQNFSKWIDRLVTPSGYPFLNLLVTEFKIKSGDEFYDGNVQRRFMLRGKATMSIQEDGDTYDLTFRKEVPDFICNSMASAFEATLLKYALLDGKSLPLRILEREGTLIHDFLNNIHFKKSKTRSRRI